MLVFADSFDYYNDPSFFGKWNPGFAGCGGIDLSGTVSRTGIGAMVLGACVLGPYRAFPAMTELIVGGAVNPGGGAIVFRLQTLGGGGGPARWTGQVVVGADMSVLYERGDIITATILQSAPNVCLQNGYNYIEAHVVLRTTPTGSVTLRVNGQVVASVSNVVTVGNFGTLNACDGLQLCGTGGVSTTVHDDFYLLDPTVPPNTTFLGPVRIYACLPFVDAAPLQWTPSVPGDHFPLVNSIPPDLAKWVESNTVGEKDQYRHDASAIPLAVNVLAVQHTLLALLDAAGARSVASSVDGVVSPTSFALSLSPGQYLTPYDVDPSTGLPWVLADLVNTTVAGPFVAA